MMGNWTPGPWRVAYRDENGQTVVSGEHYEIATCWHHCVGSIEKEAIANARLIAAAPMLAEALAPFADIADDYGDDDPDDLPIDEFGVSEQITLGDCRRARAAIAAAKGEAK